MLEKLDKRKFVSKEIKVVLENDTARRYTEKSFVAEPPDKLAFLLLSHGQDIFIEIVPKELRFQKSFSRTNSWNFELFKKETIAKIKLHSKGNLLKSVE